MSANNFLYIKQAEEKEFVIYHCCAEVVDPSSKNFVKRFGGVVLRRFRTVAGAIKFATKYQKTHPVEYGLEIELLKDQELVN